MGKLATYPDDAAGQTAHAARKLEEITMDTTSYVTYISVGMITAIVCGKWAMELGFRQSRQALWMIAGLLFPPLVLLALYARLLRQLQHEGKAGGRL